MPSGRGGADATQTAELTAATPPKATNWAPRSRSMATAIVTGSAAHRVGSNAEQGAAYVFVMPAGGMEKHDPDRRADRQATAKRPTSSATPLRSLPTRSSPALSAHKVGANNLEGAAYVFTKPAGGWENKTQTAELTASDGAERDHLGDSVAVSGRARSSRVRRLQGRLPRSARVRRTCSRSPPEPGKT